MASKRRIGHLIGGMRLGDMAAALEGRRMRRAEQRDAAEREARRLQAANMAIGQVIGAFGEHAERQRQDARQAMLDEERRSDREFERSRLTAEDKRRETEFLNRQIDRTLAHLGPGLAARADESLEPDAVGAWIFGGDLDDPDDVQIVDARGNALDDMVTTLTSAGLSRAEAESLAKDALRGAEGRQAQRMASLQAAERQAADDEREARIAEAQAALAAAKTETERARARKLLAEARKAARTPAAAAAAPKKTAADYAPDEVLPKELQAHPDVTKKMVEYELLEAAIDDVMAAKDELRVDTGPVRGLLGEIANWLGIEAIEPAALRAMTGEVFARYVQSISGAAASDKEVQRLMRNMATMRDQDDVFAAKLQVMKRLTQIRKDALLRTYQMAGVPLGRWTVSTQPASQEQAPAARPAGGGLSPEQRQALESHEQALLAAGMPPDQIKQQLRAMLRSMRGGS